jgi:hypothetical protein
MRSKSRNALGNVGRIFPGFGRKLFDGVRGPFAFAQSAKALRFLERVDVEPKEILNDLRFEGFLVRESGDANGNLPQARSLRDAVAPCARYDLEMAVLTPHQKRRENPLATNAFGQFLQLLLVKCLSRVGHGFDQLRNRNADVLEQCLCCCFRAHLFLLLIECFVCLGLFSSHSGSPQNRGAAVRTGTVRLDFAAFVTQRGGVFFANQNGFANLFEGSSVSFEELVHRQAVSISAHGWFISFAVSILFGQKQGRNAAVRFGNHPYLGVTRRSAVAAEEPEAALQAELVFLAVFFAEFAPIAAHVPCEEFERCLSCFSESGQRAGCGDNLAERKQRCFGCLLHEIGSPSEGLVFCPLGNAERCTKNKLPFMAGQSACPSAPSRARFVRSLERSGSP